MIISKILEFISKYLPVFIVSFLAAFFATWFFYYRRKRLEKGYFSVKLLMKYKYKFNPKDPVLPEEPTIKVQIKNKGSNDILMNNETIFYSKTVSLFASKPTRKSILYFVPNTSLVKAHSKTKLSFFDINKDPLSVFDSNLLTMTFSNNYNRLVTIKERKLQRVVKKFELAKKQYEKDDADFKSKMEGKLDKLLVNKFQKKAAMLTSHKK